MSSPLLLSKADRISPYAWGRLLLTIALGLFLSGCQSSPVGYPPAAMQQGFVPRHAYSKTGTASFYSNSLHGRPTASGMRYNRRSMTAAHHTLPLGSQVRVTHLQTGRSVDVLINDRMGHKKRIIDLSYAAAYQLGMVRQGLAKVRVDLIALPQKQRRR